MQVLKDEIRQKILRIAEFHFYNLGFEKAAMRKIAAEVGISVSNLYRYFKNKEAIFDKLLRPYYHRYRKEFFKFMSTVENQTLHVISEQAIIDLIFNSIRSDRVKFILLMQRSSGTVFSDFRQEVINGFRHHLQAFVPDQKKDSFILRLFAQNFFYNIIEIADQYENDDWAYHNIKIMVNYHINGMKGIQ